MSRGDSRFCRWGVIGDESCQGLFLCRMDEGVRFDGKS